jgi:hypothetical protein
MFYSFQIQHMKEEEGDPELKNRGKTKERFNKSDSHTHTHSVTINSNMHGSDQLPQHPH